MNQQTSTGILAFVIVLGACAAGAVLLYINMTVPSPISPSKPSIPIEKTAKGDAALAKIAAHRFWNKKPASDEVERWIAGIVNCVRGDLVYIDQNGGFAIVRYADLDFGTKQQVDGSPGEHYWLFIRRLKPLGIDDRFVLLNMGRRSVRPNREDMLRELETELDAAEFRGK